MAIGLVGLILLLIAATTLSTSRGNAGARLNYEAQLLAQGLLESYQARSVADLPLGDQPQVTGEFANGTSYTAVVTLTSLGSNGPADGLTDQEVKGAQVKVEWTDSAGTHQERVEGILVKIAR